MKVRGGLLFILSGVALLLAACGSFAVVPQADIQAEIQPTQITYTVTVTEEEDDEGNVSVTYNLQVEGVVLSARARPGSMGVTLTGYTVDYYYGDGTPVPFPTNARFSGRLNLRVLPGIICDDIAVRECTVNSPGASFHTGPAATSSAFFPLDPDTGYTIFFAPRSPEAAYAVITLMGVDDLNRPFSKVLDPITILQFVVSG